MSLRCLWNLQLVPHPRASSVRECGAQGRGLHHREGSGDHQHTGRWHRRNVWNCPERIRQAREVPRQSPEEKQYLRDKDPSPTANQGWSEKYRETQKNIENSQRENLKGETAVSNVRSFQKVKQRTWSNVFIDFDSKEVMGDFDENSFCSWWGHKSHCHRLEIEGEG